MDDVICKRCGATIAADGIKVTEMVATCADCGTVAGLREPREAAGRERPAVAMPAGMLVERGAGGEPGSAAGDPYRSPGRVRGDLIMAWRWFRKKHLFLFAFTAVWWSFLFFWYLVVSFVDGPILFHIVGLAHAAGGLLLAYVCLALWRNSTRISLEGDVLRVAHAPLPWPGARTLIVAEIEQIYCTEGVAYTVNQQPVPGYNVRVKTRGAGDLTLVKNLPDPEQALYLEQQLERVLDITDREMPGELGS